MGCATHLGVQQLAGLGHHVLKHDAVQLLTPPVAAALAAWRTDSTAQLSRWARGRTLVGRSFQEATGQGIRHSHEWAQALPELLHLLA